MQFIPYLSFRGDCRAAFAFYAGVFGVPVPEAMTYGDAPPEMQAEMCADGAADTRHHVMHTQLDVAGGVLMGADGPVREGTGSDVVVNIALDDVAEAERVFAALLDGGTIDMPLQETFWARRFGMGRDRFGKAWMVNCGEPC